MKYSNTCIAGFMLPLIILSLQISARTINEEQALNVANNWIAQIIHEDGDWGGSQTAVVQEIQQFKYEHHTLGYYCHVSPRGNIIISLHKQFAPIMAYSETSDLDPESDMQMTGLIKRNRLRSLNQLEKQQISPSTNVETSWFALSQDTETFTADLETLGSATYTPNTHLLTSMWHQGYPYNILCPEGDTCNHCPVGCVALAGAQIMRYWAWPPTGIHWPSMPDDFSSGMDPSTVAFLCLAVGTWAGVDYSCNSSDAWCGDKPGKDMVDAFEEHFQYSTDAYFDLRLNNPGDLWYDIIKSNINQNRPLQYCTCEYDFPGVAGHSLVLDGWRETAGIFMGHMNDGDCEWYDMTDRPGAEGMIKDIKPNVSLGPAVFGTYIKMPFPYRYFDQDCLGVADFYEGQQIQFLPSVRVISTGLIQFFGTATENTRLYSLKGTSDGMTVGEITIKQGMIKLHSLGTIRFHSKK